MKHSTATRRLVASALRPAMLGCVASLLSVAAWGGGVVTDCTEAALRSAMAGGGAVTFACDGTITLGNTITIAADTVLDASGRAVTISGGGSIQVFHVNAGVSFTILGLGLANGHTTLGGGGVYNPGGTVNATNCAFWGNVAYGSVTGLPDEALPACGGAIYNAGTLNASQCRFFQNQAVGVKGRDGTDGGYFNAPGRGYAGGSAFGGAIYNVGTMALDRSLIASNGAAGGTGGRGGDGNISTFWPCPDQSGGNGSGGGTGAGGDLFHGGTGNVVNCTFAWNIAAGGAAGRGGNGGLINWNPHSASGCPGGNGGGGGGGFGTIYHSSGSLHLTNCTIALNSAVPGLGGAAGGGSLGRPSGSAGGDGIAWGGVSSSGSILLNTLLGTNFPGGNLSGSLVDAGHNLSSDGSCAFANIGSLNNTDPKLGPLANNGGPTLTMALLLGSPAMDTGDTAAAPATDQRGYVRPAGVAADIGAFEYGAMIQPVLAITRSSAGAMDITAYGSAGKSCRLFASPDLVNWVPIATNRVSWDGTVVFHDTCVPGVARRFYRLVMP